MDERVNCVALTHIKATSPQLPSYYCVALKMKTRRSKSEHRIAATTSTTAVNGESTARSNDRVTPKNFSGHTRTLMEQRVAQFNNNCHQGPFVCIRWVYCWGYCTNNSLDYSPKDELTFRLVPGEQDRVDFVLLKNTGDKGLVYKIKTTSPEKFRVRPSCGYLPPQDRTIVRIYLQSGEYGSIL